MLFETMLGPFGDGGSDIDGDGRPDLVISNRNLHRDHEPDVRANTVDAIAPSRADSIRRWTGGEGFGYRVAMAGDTDHDGSGDVLVTQGDVKGASSSVSLLSGASGETLWSRSGDDIGDDLARLGDIDGDGCEDFALTIAKGLTTQKGDYMPSGEFGFEVRSGRDGHVLAQFARSGTRYLPGFAAIRGFTDFDLDGVPDILAALPADLDGHGFSKNRLVIISGATNQCLVDLPTVDVSEEGHESIACLGDLDGDGRSEIGAGCAEDAVVRIVSPATTRTLFTFRGERGGAFGWAVAGPGDMDGDSVPDVVVGNPLFEGFNSSPTAYVRLFSGATGAELATVNGSVEDDSWSTLAIVGKPHDFGICVRAAGDINGDGRADVLVGEDRYFATSSALADRTVIIGLVAE
jgi:hypothetical protein